MTEAQKDILWSLYSKKHLFTNDIRAMGEDALRIIYGLRDAKVVYRDGLLGGWRLTDKGMDLVQGFIKTFSTPRNKSVKSYRPFGILSICLIDDKADVRLDRRMKGKSIYIEKETWAQAWKKRTTKDDCFSEYAIPFAPEVIHETKGGWIFEGSRPRRGQHLLLSQEQLKRLRF